MRAAALRISTVAGVDERVALRLAILGILATGAIIGGAVLTRGLLPAAGLAGALLVIVASIRWPLMLLYAYVFLIPLEELIVLGPFGTVTRIVGLLFIVAYALPRIGRLRLTAMPAAAWAYLGWALVSIVWALDPTVAMAEAAVLILLFAIGTLIAAVVVDRPSVVRPLLWAYSVSATIIALYGLFLFLMGLTVDGNRIAALPGQDPAYYSALLLPAFAFSLDQLVRGRTIVTSATVALISLTGIVVSGTRGAWVSAAVIVLLFMLPRISTPKRLITIAGLLLALMASLQVPAVSDLLTQRTEIAVSSGGAGRTDIWTVGIGIIQEAPIVGVGLANFPTAYTAELVRDSDVGVYSANNPAHRAPHSIIIGTLGELGVIGFAILCLLILPLLFRPGWGVDGVAVQAALASLVMSALFLDIINRKQFWLIVGLACGLAYVARSERLRVLTRPTIAAST
jgi:exopolysaccharide production protein ExoQ